MNTQAYMMELMLRAPAIPDWFMPGTQITFCQAPENNYTDWKPGQQEKRLIEWPSYYAKAVMEAAGIIEEVKFKGNIPIPTMHQELKDWLKSCIESFETYFAVKLENNGERVDFSGKDVMISIVRVSE